MLLLRFSLIVPSNVCFQTAGPISDGAGKYCTLLFVFLCNGDFFFLFSAIIVVVITITSLLIFLLLCCSYCIFLLLLFISKLKAHNVQQQSKTCGTLRQMIQVTRQ